MASQHGEDDMKATTDDEIRTLVDVTADFSDRVIPSGTRGVIVEAYDSPVEGYAVDLAIPDDDLVGGYAYENVVLFPDQFVVIGDEAPQVLFVCVHNAGRSQMAAALLDHHAKGRVRVRSAGSAPADRINPAVTAAMDEIGIDLSQALPRPLTDEVVRAADVVVTMGCGDACPVYPGKRYEDWELQDPAGQPVEVVRRIRDDLDARVRRLLAELVPSA
jgi:arsenate reductase (thioredoxin)